MMPVVEYLARCGRTIAELLGITDMFQHEETYGAFGMSIFIVIFFVLFGWIIIRKARTTRRMLVRFAVERGFSFSPKDKRLMSSDFSAFPLFRRGSARGVKNVFKGQFENTEFTLFDYWYKNPGMSHTYLVAVFPARYNLPEFDLRPESIADKISEKFGQKDIDFEMDREFSKRYLLSGTDEVAVRDLFNEGVRSFFNSIERNKIGGVEGGGHSLVFYQWNADYMSRKPDKYLMDIRKCLYNAYNVYATFRKLQEPSHTGDAMNGADPFSIHVSQDRGR